MIGDRKREIGTAGWSRDIRLGGGGPTRASNKSVVHQPLDLANNLRSGSDLWALNPAVRSAYITVAQSLPTMRFNILLGEVVTI